MHHKPEQSNETIQKRQIVFNVTAPKKITPMLQHIQCSHFNIDPNNTKLII